MPTKPATKTRHTATARTELVAVANTPDIAAESPPRGEDILPSDIAGLDRKLAQLHWDHFEITTSIQNFRIRLRDGQLNASATHTALDPKEIKFCKGNIAQLHTRLTSVQAAISRVGKALRAARTATPAASRVLDGRKMITGRDGEPHLVPRRDSAHHSVLVLESFMRLCQQELPQEQFGRLMAEAILLAKDIQKVGLENA